jgi:hypothetical protein
MEQAEWLFYLNAKLLETKTVKGGTPTRTVELRPSAALINDLVIHFNAKRLADPGQLMFRYRMDGYNTEWKETQDRSAHYGRLLPGRYKFQVEARNAGDAWNGIYAEVEINQQAFFYQTLWFACSCWFPSACLRSSFFAGEWRGSRVSWGSSSKSAIALRATGMTP